jgi:hypothetical protein
VSGSHYIIKILLASCLLLFAIPAFAQDVIDTDVHAVIMLNKATSKHRYQSNTIVGPNGHSAKLRSYRNSNVAANHQALGGGISLGNIISTPGTNKSHSTTVVVQGHIINSSK